MEFLDEERGPMTPKPKHWLDRMPRQNKGCLNCGPLYEKLPWGAWLSVGFGACQITRDGEGIYNESPDIEVAPPRLRKFTRRAKKEPGHDWRVHFAAPLYDAEYQWQGNAWYLVKKGMGFA
jgi:hypothetical protein